MDTILERVRGRYTTEQRGVFIDYTNNAIEGILEKEPTIILYHELYHHWQMLFTKFGQNKWAINREFMNFVMDEWKKIYNLRQDKVKIPLNNMTENFELLAIDVKKIIVDIIIHNDSVNILKLNEFHIDKYNLIFDFQIAPEIILDGKPYILNGIDILESSAKYQEAFFAKIAYNMPFREVYDKSKLPIKYYSAWQYFQENVQADRMLEFPIICDLSLQGKLSLENNEEAWKASHPSWRFVKLVNALSFKSEQIPLLSFDDIEEKYKDYVNKIYNICGFEKNESNNSEKDLKSDLKLISQYAYAKSFIEKYPFALSFPLINTKVYERIKQFEPMVYKFSDETQYSEKYSWEEIAIEIHLQAFSEQILGNKTDYFLDNNAVHCGFSYYGYSGCTYKDSGKCTGCILPEEGFSIGHEIDPVTQNVTGCSFSVWLLMSGIDVAQLNIDFNGDNCKLCTSMKIAERIMKEYDKKL